MIRLLAIFCVLIQGSLSIFGAPMAATACADCTVMVATPPQESSDDGRCSCCTGMEGDKPGDHAPVKCCCRADSEKLPSPPAPAPGQRAADLLEQLCRLAAIPPALPVWHTSDIPLPQPPTRADATDVLSVHLERVISTTHLLV